jgi:UDP-N-acetylmuramoyl-tripeptide--D-alanyl-D-alanine ligase
VTLWTPQDAAQAMAATVSGAAIPISGISIDTRTLEKGDLFFALKDVRDGHDFVSAALAKGAAGAVVLRARLKEFEGQGALYGVDDVLGALVALGLAARARVSAQIVAVTGSVGKTGTKEALKALLLRQGRTHASVASYNNHWGVPLTLARMPADTQFGIFEIGMNHANEITPLTKMVRPHVAVITAIAPVHLENLGSLEAIADAKGEIFDGLQPDATAILPADSPFASRLAAHAMRNHATRIRRFGESDTADPRLVAVTLDETGSDAIVAMDGAEFPVRFGSPGKHTALNGLAVLAAIAALGGDVKQAAQDFATVTPPSGRGQRAVLGGITLIDESYNANPASMRAAFSVLGSAAKTGRKIVALGDMLELGPDEIAMHRDLAPDLAQHGIDRVYAAGARMKHLFDALPDHQRGAWAPDATALTPLVLNALKDGDVIMIKGSNSSRMSHIVRAIKDRFENPQTGGEA